MEFVQLFHVLKVRWRIVALCALVVLALALGYRLAFPPGYKAVASVIVDPRGINPVTGGATQQSQSQDSVLATYATIARSEGIARQVVERLPDTYAAKLKALWLASHKPEDPGFEGWAARILMKGVDVRPGGQASFVFDIGYTDRDGIEAAKLANAYANALIDYSRQMRTSAVRKDAEYFKVQAVTLRSDTEAAEQRLADFQRQHQITSTDDRVDVETARLAVLNNQAVLNQDLSTESSSRARQLGASTEVVTNPLVQTLTTALAEKESRYRELASRFGPEHPELILAARQVQEARAVLDRETRAVTDSMRTSSVVARTRADALRNDSEKQRQKVVELNSLRVLLSSLEKDVAQKRKLYESALQRSSETGLEAGSQREDLMMLTEALPPDGRAGPGAMVLMLLATVVGGLIGVLVAVTLERLTPRLHVMHDLETMGIPVLQVIPLMSWDAPSYSGPKLLGSR